MRDGSYAARELAKLKIISAYEGWFICSQKIIGEKREKGKWDGIMRGIMEEKKNGEVQEGKNGAVKQRKVDI